MSTEDIFDITDAPELPELDHTLLKMWSEVLGNIDTERDAKVRPQVALGLLSTWPILELEDITEYIRIYYSMLDDYRNVVTAAAKAHPEALEIHGEGDAVENRDLYLTLAGRWQQVQNRHEDSWTVDMEGSASWIAALSDTTNFVLGPTGLIAHLDQIGITPTDAELETIDKIRTEGR